MYKKLIILVFVIAALSISASAAPSAANPLKVDLNGNNASGDTARTQPGWEGWDFEFAPTVNTFNKAWIIGGSKVSVELKGIKYDGTNPQTRMRSDQPSAELGDVHQDFFFVATTAADLGLCGLDYIQIRFAFGHEVANQTFRVTVWDYDDAFSTTQDPYHSVYGAWGIVNPSTYGGYQVTRWDDPCTPEDENGIYKNPVPTLARTYIHGRPYPAESNDITAFTYSSTFEITTDDNGCASIYGWYDGDYWCCSYHMPINGFMIVPEPAIVLLLGFGAVMLRKRKS